MQQGGPLVSARVKRRTTFSGERSNCQRVKAMAALRVGLSSSGRANSVGGVTDHLGGAHSHRDFQKFQDY